MSHLPHGNEWYKQYCTIKLLMVEGKFQHIHHEAQSICIQVQTPAYIFEAEADPVL